MLGEENRCRWGCSWQLAERERERDDNDNDEGDASVAHIYYLSLASLQVGDLSFYVVRIFQRSEPLCPVVSISPLPLKNRAGDRVVM